MKGSSRWVLIASALLSCLGLLVPGIAFGEDWPKAYGLCLQGDQAMRRQDCRAACELYEQALKLYSHPDIKKRLANAYVFYAGRLGPGQAAVCFRRAYELDPGNQSARSWCQRHPGAAAQADETLMTAAPDGGVAFVPGRSSVSHAGAARQGYQAAPAGLRDETRAPEPRSYFLAQNNDPRWNRDAPANDGNCGPTCLAMACKRFGLYPPRMDANTPPQELILGCRLLMTGALNQNLGTNAFQWNAAAKILGFKSSFVGSFDDVDRAINRGAVVAVGGCPWVDRSYGPRYAGSHHPVFHNGHCILVVGKQGGYFVVADPLYFDGPINVAQVELQSFLSFHRSQVLGIAVTR